jgi:hypothetical protein
MGKGKVFVIDCDIYHVDIIVCAGVPFETAIKKYEKHFNRTHPRETLDRNIQGAVIRTPGYKGSCIWFKHLKPGAGVASHEIFHAVFGALYFSGVGLTENSEEAWAYMIDWVTRQIGKRLW